MGVYTYESIEIWPITMCCLTGPEGQLTDVIFLRHALPYYVLI